MKIAITGKGGVGKTLIAGSLAYFFTQEGQRTIAVDVDSSPNLALTLGLSLEESRSIVPISENQTLIETKTSTAYQGVYRLLFTVDNVIRDFSIKTPLGVNLLVMGTVKAMGSGCACPANAVVRALLRHLIVERNEVIVLDMEAGVEHLGRGTAEFVDTMLIVTDATMKSLETAKNIYDIAKSADIKKIFLVGNKVENNHQTECIEQFAHKYDLEILTILPFDQEVMEVEIQGRSPLLNRDSLAFRALKKLSKNLPYKKREQSKNRGRKKEKVG